MEIKTENTAAEPVMLHTDSQDKYSPTNLMLYRTSLALVHNLVDEGVFTEKEYRKIRAILNKKYGLPLDSIFAESA